MELITKAQIIQEFATDYLADKDYNEFFAYHDLGVPLSVMYSNHMVSLESVGTDILNETYNNLCELVNVDINKEFEDYDDFFFNSDLENTPPLSDE